MPNHINQRITRLRELVQQRLHEESLDRAVQECNSLVQDSPHALLFFTLKNIFRELADALEGGAVEVHRFEELTRSFSEKALLLLQNVASGRSATPDELEELVRARVVNRN